MAASPSTPVDAAAMQSVPLYEVPVMPTLPVDQKALTSSPPSGLVKPFARPFSQSITAFGASASFAPPQVGTPCESPVPGDEECTTANPRGTHSATRPSLIRSLFGLNAMAGGASCGSGVSSSSCRGFHTYLGDSAATAAKYGLVS